MLGGDSKTSGLNIPDLPFPNMGMPRGRNPFERPSFPGMPISPNLDVPSPDGNIDVDELIKRIDAKIAELEEEERLEKEQANKPVIEAKEEPEEQIDKIIPNLPPKRVEIPKVEEKENKPQMNQVHKEIESQTSSNVTNADEDHSITIPVDNQISKVDELGMDLPKAPIYDDDAIYSDTYITDDQFFDDFFYDEDE